MVVAVASLGSSFSGERAAVAIALPGLTIERPVVREAREEAPAHERAAWAEALRPLVFSNVKTGAASTARLYAADGSVDPVEALAIDRVLAEKDAEARPLDRRVLQLVIKAAAHFGAGEVVVVSSWRDSARPGSQHRRGAAIDFMLPGVPPLKLAAYLRSGARVGVGVYTHKLTQFVHLDSREASYHWADASPPGRWWRESRMTDWGAKARDAAYEPAQDLPEH